MNAQFLTAPGVLALAGGLLMVAGIMAPVLSWAFCTRPAPRPLRQWRDLALAIVGARLLTRDNMSLDIDAWFVTAIWLHLAIAQCCIAAYYVLAILPPRSDTCRKERKLGMKILLLMFFILSSLLPLGAAAQETPCPAGFSCVTYEGAVIEIDPADGPVQAVVVRERHLETLSFETNTRENSVVIALFLSGDDGFKLDRTFTVEQEGKFSDARLGDVLTLTEAISGN